MRCCRRSIPSFVSALLVALLAAPAGAAGPDETAASPAATEAVSAAIRRAVEARLGRDVAVSVWSITALRLADESQSAFIVAVPDPSARIGQPVRFVLNRQLPGKRPTRAGDVTATIQAVGPAVVTTREVARGARLEAADIAVVSTDLAGRTLRPLPTLDEAIGARVTRDLVMRDVLAHNDVAASTLIKPGDIVQARARIGGVEVSGQMVAAEGGRRNDVIRVVNQETRFAARARVIDKGEVEVVNVK